MSVNAMMIHMNSIKSTPDILDMINDIQNYISINNIDNSEILCQQLLNIK